MRFYSHKLDYVVGLNHFISSQNIILLIWRIVEKNSHTHNSTAIRSKLMITNDFSYMILFFASNEKKKKMEKESINLMRDKNLNWSSMAWHHSFLIVICVVVMHTNWHAFISIWMWIQMHTIQHRQFIYNTICARYISFLQFIEHTFSTSREEKETERRLNYGHTAGIGPLKKYYLFEVANTVRDTTSKNSDGHKFTSAHIY